MHSSSFPSLRLRRGRSSQWIRNLLNENKLTSDDLIWPIFICEGENKKDEISSMPNVYRYSIDQHLFCLDHSPTLLPARLLTNSN